MSKANIRLSWQGSPTWDVKSYKIKIIDERIDTPSPVIVDKSVAASVRSFDFEAEQGAIITASVMSHDGKCDSQPSTTIYVVPDLEPPLPPCTASLDLVGSVD